MIKTEDKMFTPNDTFSENDEDEIKDEPSCVENQF